MIYFDEAGNSGDNLLDPAQPAYVLVSHDFSDSESKKILGPLMAVSKADELHFKSIRKYGSRRKALLECLNHEALDIDRIFYYAADKSFMVTVHMIDQLAETVMHRSGIDIYQYGINISTANVLYAMGRQVWDRKLFDIMCASFIRWVRSASVADRISFYNAALNLAATLTREEDHDLLNLILFSARYVQEIESSFGKYSLDPTLSCFVVHCSHWAKRYSKPFDITVDDSKQLNYWKDMIEFLARELPEAEVGYGSRKHKYPLLINSLRHETSTASIELQLADILASSLNHIFIHRFSNTEDGFATDLIATKLSKIVGNSMEFSTAVTPEDLDMTDASGQNPLDFIAGIAERKPGRYSKATRR